MPRLIWRFGAVSRPGRWALLRLVDRAATAVSSPCLSQRVAYVRGRTELLLLADRHAPWEEVRPVLERDVSFGPVSAAGRQAWDTFQGLAATAEKLGISFWSYVVDHVQEAGEIPPLSELSAHQAAADPRPASWAAA